MRLGLDSATVDVWYCFRTLRFHEIVMDAVGGVPLRILEAGCGSGKLSIHWAMNGAEETVLLDIDPDMVEYSRHLASACRQVLAAVGKGDVRVNTNHVRGDVHSLPYPDRYFDLVFNEGLLEHFPPPEQAAILREMGRVSRAWVAFQVPNAEDPKSVKIAAEARHSYAGMPEKEVPLLPDDCRAAVNAAGLKLILLQPYDRYLVGVARRSA